MSEPPKDIQKRHEELMRQAGEARRHHAVRMLELERIKRREIWQSSRLGKRRWGGATRMTIAHLNLEIESLAAKLAVSGDTEESIMLKAELAHLRRIRDQFAGIGRRKPPEAGIAVPAVPPRGPLPMQGGAEAPLDFDRE